MTFKKFLLIAGIGAILFGLAGFFGIIGPVPERSIFGHHWWVPNIENWNHLIFGLISIMISLFVSNKFQKAFMWFMTFLTLGVAIYSITARYFLMVTFEDPFEEIIYFTMGNLALLVLTKEARQQQKLEMEKFRLFNKNIGFKGN